MIKISIQKLITILIVTSLISALMGTFILPYAHATSPGYIDRISIGDYEDTLAYFTMKADGSDVQPETKVKGVLSPDGTKRLYQEFITGYSFEIFVSDADGSNPVNLTNSTAQDSHPDWSADGSQIAFYSSRGTGAFDILVMDADGSNVQIITDNGNRNLWPKWSPDGQYIAYHSLVDGAGTRAVVITDPAGAEHTALTTETLTSLSSTYDWISDTEIVINGTIDGVFGVYIVDITDSSATLVSDSIYAPLAYWMNVYGDMVFAESDDDWESSWIQITKKNGDIVNIDFRDQGILLSEDVEFMPDGRIGFTGYYDTDYTESDVYLVNPDGTDLQRLTTNRKSFLSTVTHTPNLEPIVSADTTETPYNTAKTYDVLLNDTDEEEFDAQYLTIKTQPLNGTATVVDGKVKYTPNDGFKGSDQLTYQICDAFVMDQKCATGVLSVTVQAPDAPILQVNKVDGAEFNAEKKKYESSSKRPTFSGAASPGSEIKVEIHSDPIVLTTTADGEGNWSVTPSEDLPVGDHTVYITATLDGVTTELDSFVLAITDEAEIPNTGANAAPLRLGGMVALIAGIGIMYWQRRRLRQHLPGVPPLWV